MRIALLAVLMTASPPALSAQPASAKLLISGEGMDIDIAFARDGRRMAYASSRTGSLELWLRSLDGGPLYQLTTSTSASADRFPTFTPDGKSIIFQSDRAGGVRNVWSLDLASRGLTQLTTVTEGGASHPAVSADGNSICYTRTSRSGSLSIWVIGIDRRNAREMGEGMDCAWTPDGSIVFSRSSNAASGSSYQIWAMDGTGQNLRQISPAQHSWTRSPAVSPDGQWISYSVYEKPLGSDIQEVQGGFQVVPGLRADIWVAGFGTSSAPPRQLTSAAFNSFSAWLPDGRSVAFTSTRSGSADIWSVATDR